MNTKSFNYKKQSHVTSQYSYKSCHEDTKPDEWSTESNCINCGPNENEMLENLNDYIVVGEN
jgi:hypothetical protein